LNRVWKIIRGRPRLFASAGLGIVAGVLLSSGIHPITRALLAWDIACAALLVLSAHFFSSDRPGGMAADAERQEEGEWTVFWVTVGAVTASFVAILGEFALLKDLAEPSKSLHVGLVAATLFVSWLMTHTVFTYRYAHEYYECDEANGKITGGLAFPDDAVPDYWDFFYFSLVLGMTFQVSDVQITRRSLRRLAAAHGLLGFLFNTVILALTVNIGASLL
jgi:uncharacterized membrane protein